jgi:hypothetical protein
VPFLPGRRGGIAATVLLLALVAAPARSQTAADADGPAVAAALVLFEEGRRLLAAGETDRACAKLAESHRLDPGGGTLLNLALCHEKQGRVATAWAEFQDALRRARVDRRADRVAFATQHLTDLEPRLPRVEIVVEGTDQAGLLVTLNGTDLGSAAFGSMIPVDPGVVTVVASAPGKRPWKVAQPVVEGQFLTIRIEPLQANPSPVARARPARVLRTDAPSAAHRTPTWAYAAAAGGLTAIGVSGAFGWLAIDRRDQSDRECPGGRCDAAGVAYNEQAQRLADVATGAAIVGLAGLAVGVWGIWLLPGTERAGVQVQVSPLRWSVGARF